MTRKLASDQELIVGKAHRRTKMTSSNFPSSTSTAVVRTHRVTEKYLQSIPGLALPIVS